MSAPDAWVHTGYAQRVHAGSGVAARLPEIVKETGARRVLVVTTEGRMAGDDGPAIVRRLGRMVVGVFTGTRPQLPTSVVQAALLVARREGIDGVVSVGGGSCTDLGKAITHFLEIEQGTPGASYVDRPAVAHVAVPTTFSGAALIPVFAVTDERTRVTTGAGGPTVAPLAVVCDPLLTRSTPVRVSAETAAIALAHGVEAACAPQRSPEAEALALEGIRRIAAALPRVCDDPDDLDARAALLAAATLTGRAVPNATLGVLHGVAQLLAGRTGIAHGLADAVLLPHAMRFNADAVPDELARVGAALGDPDDAPAAVARLVQQVGLPSRLRDCGVDEADLDAVARMSGRSEAVHRNPRPAGEADVRAILQDAW